MSGTGPETVLVVDPGHATTKAILIHDGRLVPVTEPGTGLRAWPTAAHQHAGDTRLGTAARTFGRAYPGEYLGGGHQRARGWMLAAVLRAVKRHGTTPERLVVVVDAEPDERWPAFLQRMAEHLGFADAEFVPRTAAAAYTDRGPDTPGVVLSFDLGERGLHAGLVRVSADGYESLGHTVAEDCGGRAAQAALAAHVRELGGTALERALATDHLDADAAACVAMDFAAAVRRLRHALSMAPVAADRPLATGPVVEVRREAFEALLAPLVKRAIAATSDLLERAGPTVDRVVFTGGMTSIPYVIRTVGAAIGLPGRSVEMGEGGVVTGAARLVQAMPPMTAAPAPADGQVPVRWDAAGARLVRWLVEPGETFEARAELAVVRTEDGGLRRLRAPDRPGHLVRRHAEPGTVLAGGAWAATVGVLEATSVSVRAAPRGPVRSIAFSADGRRIAAGVEGAVCLLDGDGRPLSQLTVRGTARAVAFAAGGKQVWAGTDGPLERWEIDSGRRLWSVAVQDSVLDLAVSPDERYFAVATAGWNSILYAGPSQPPRWSRKNSGSAVAFSPDGTVLAMIAQGVELIDLKNGQPSGRRFARAVATGGGHRLVFSRGGDRLAVANRAGTVQCCYPRTATTAWTATEPGGVTGLAFTPRGDRLVVAGARIAVFETLHGKLVADHPLGAPVHAMALAPDGVTLALGTDDGVRLMRLEDQP
ncbi:Hsp70 family protein [Dactylosporangium sp. CS-047395]|uniref:Hsp70 family protein n=1 Tax=Dactylosporangium sp. CS-047395 TaxID=3239936 RepID=UPI003D921386